MSKIPRLLPAEDRQTFLRWLFVNVVYLSVLVGAKMSYHGHIHPIGLFAIGAILVLFATVSGYAGYLCWNERIRGVQHITLGFELAPKLAMLGTVGGFLIAFSHGTSDIQHRVLGASTGLAATFIGILTMITLEIIRHIVEES